jgi:hypothetical protein
MNKEDWAWSLDTQERKIHALMADNEVLKKERDEARARVAELENIDALEAKIAPIIREADERGFERGMREAAKVLEKDGWSFPRDAILALLEPKKEGDA